MARIAGVDLPRQKHINIALTYIYGIGRPRAVRILDEAKVAQGSFDEHQAAHRNWLLSRLPAPPQPAGPRAAHAHERPDAQRSAQGNGRSQEEDGDEDLRTASSF
jgi:hypothetical protein